MAHRRHATRTPTSSTWDASFTCSTPSNRVLGASTTNVDEMQCTPAWRRVCWVWRTVPRHPTIARFRFDKTCGQPIGPDIAIQCLYGNERHASPPSQGSTTVILSLKLNCGASQFRGPFLRTVEAVEARRKPDAVSRQQCKGSLVSSITGNTVITIIQYGPRSAASSRGTAGALPV